MGFLDNWITEFIKELLVGSIMSNLGGLFDDVNTQIADIAGTVGMAPGAFHPGVFALIRNLSETVILPIAGLILTFLATYELINLIVDKNNLNEVDTWMFFRWSFKTFIAVLILSNTFPAVMAIFDVAQSLVSSAGGLISADTAVSADMMATFEAELMEMSLGPLIGLWLQSYLVQVVVTVINIVIFVIVYGRIIEIFALTSLAPIPFATLSNREFGSMGQNYFKSLCAVGLQGFLIMVCVGMYAVMVQSIATDGDPIRMVWRTLGYTTLLAAALFKSGSLAKGVLGAH